MTGGWSVIVLSLVLSTLYYIYIYIYTPSGHDVHGWEIPEPNGGLSLRKSMNIIYKRGIVHCHVWLMEGILQYKCTVYTFAIVISQIMPSVHGWYERLLKLRACVGQRTASLIRFKNNGIRHTYIYIYKSIQTYCQFKVFKNVMWCAPQNGKHPSVRHLSKNWGIRDYQIYGNFMQFPWGYVGYDLIDKIIKIDIRAQRNPCFWAMAERNKTPPKPPQVLRVKRNWVSCPF